MITDFKTPIKCPKCHELLTSLQMTVSKVLEWTIDDEEDNIGRFEDNGQGATEVFCHNCGKQIDITTLTQNGAYSRIIWWSTSNFI